MSVVQERSSEVATPAVGDSASEVGGSDSGTQRPRRRWVPRSRRARLLVAAGVVAIVAATAVWWTVLRDDAEDQVATATEQLSEVTVGTAEVTVAAEGTVTSAQTAQLSFASAGTVTSVEVEAGDTVTTGQVLAAIDSAELAAAVADAEAAVAEAEAQLADDEDAGASDEQIAADESALASRQDSLVNAEEALAGATLVAEFDGTVTTVGLSVGDQLGSAGAGGTATSGSGSGSGLSSSTLQSGATALPGAQTETTETTAQIEIVSSGRYAVELAVDSADIDGLEVGQEATVTVATSSAATSGFPGGGPPGMGGAGAMGSGATGSDATAGSAGNGAAATGVVTEVGRVADASSGVATYPVTVSFSDDTGEILVGSTVTAEIVTSSRDDVVQVQAFAVSTEDGTSTVTVALDGTVDGPTEQRTVETGETLGANVEIVAGLEPGEQVVVTMPDFASRSGVGGSDQELPDGFPAGGMPAGGMPSGGLQSGDLPTPPDAGGGS